MKQCPTCGGKRLDPSALMLFVVVLNTLLIIFASITARFQRATIMSLMESCIKMQIHERTEEAK